MVAEWFVSCWRVVGIQFGGIKFIYTSMSNRHAV